MDDIKEKFYSGSYQAVINESSNSGFTSSLSAKDQVSCKVLLLRRYELRIYIERIWKQRAFCSRESNLVIFYLLYLPLDTGFSIRIHTND